MKRIRADFKRKQEIFLQDGWNVSLLRILLSDGSSAMILYRMMSWCHKSKLTPLAYLFQWLNKCLNACVIGIKTSFGDGFVIMHPCSIVINSKVCGGTNITLESSVVIGDNKGHSPTLGNNIFIGSGAKIFGQLSVGNNVLIGANAVVTKSIDDNCKALGIPAKNTPFIPQNTKQQD
ncbi:serine O-acetyltransferase [Thalassotalea crassostreae]|uniref:serine O-acetyltransferase n=1 Tax=Thalassotalea crassostreae TaxID=1763536 RepID=UPI000837E0FF|nr:serine acetyltransferase [Thalassotalea crassostreae]